MIEINFYFNNKGFFTADAAPPNELLGNFIDGEINKWVGRCMEFIQAVDNAIAGKDEEFSWIGNAFSLTLTSEKAQIVLEVVETYPSLDLSLIDLKQALTKYLAFAEAQGWE